MGRTLGADLGATVLNQDIYEISATQKHRLGTRVQRGDCVYRYAKASKTLTTNQLAVHPVNLRYLVSLAIPTTAPKGSNKVIVTATGGGQLGDSAIAEHEMQGGRVMFFKAGAAEWLVMGIKDNSVAATTMTLTLDGELPFELTHTVDYCEEAICSPYLDVNHDNSGGLLPFVGMPMRLATAAEPYFWLQTWGPGRIAPQAAVGVVANNNTVVFRHDGSCDTAEEITTDAYANQTSQHAGFVMTRLANGTQSAPFIFLQIAP